MDYYDQISRGYPELHRQEQLKKLQIIRQHLTLEPTDTLLDVGCGPGYSFEVFDCDVTGVDSSKELLRRAHEKTVHANAEKLPFPDKSFDAVICVTALHNFEHPDKALKEMKRVCKRTGAITVLKKAKNKADLVRQVKQKFEVISEVDEAKDVILIFKIGGASASRVHSSDL